MGKAVSNSVIIPTHMSLAEKDNRTCVALTIHITKFWMILAPTINNGPCGDYPFSKRPALWYRPVHGHLTRNENVRGHSQGAKENSRQRKHIVQCSCIFYLTYIVHVNKGHKIHKNTILLCSYHFIWDTSFYFLLNAIGLL